MRTFLFTRRYELLALLLIVISIVRIVLTYSNTAQAFDEPCHISAAIEFLDKKTYTLDAMHPPVARIAIGLPLYAAGVRYPDMSKDDTGSHNYNVVGNKIIYAGGAFRRNLVLARIGILPFFIFGGLIVFMWASRIAGKTTALIALFLYTTTPSILAFSSIAYTDIVAASTQLAALFTFVLWLEAPTRRNTLLLGVCLGFAFGAKFTSLLFLPAAFFCMAIVWFLRRDRSRDISLSRRSTSILIALGLAVVVLWACYGFSMRPVDEAMGITPSTMPSFQHFPPSLRGALQKLILADPRLPAPELMHGLAEAWVLNQAKSESYLLGQVKLGGWWYFFLDALLVKLPMPLLVAFVIGLASLVKFRRVDELYPVAGLIGVLLVTTRVSYQAGTRHVLLCVLLITITAAFGLGRLLDREWRRPVAVLLLVLVLSWQVFESAKAQSDFIAYFNELAGPDPSKILVTGCDLDCGQDMYGLTRELRSRGINRFTLAVWSSADLDSLRLPSYNVPLRGERPSGWIAVSARALRTGAVLHEALPPRSLDWLENYKPVTKVGKTIDLYYVDPSPTTGD
jgi:4-amino-4-deoxy-L-arabinose transferase-like glycosyltransferase